ncbi:hypothetical protein BUALT_Bualt05G0053700 [Buddleja alternifolia]|uniref:Beta-Casp domain-containing protein n=1 Tax=Buddleja alternifolia TaxID=168488 RepID=A0AAV6XQB9_9LAMI|nr:hypothetical protein BUALT_Bualt05G0053700 [Buddleja alternifolia]
MQKAHSLSIVEENKAYGLSEIPEPLLKLLRDCMLKVESLKYGEEVCYNGILILKAFSSGLEIGTCNWSITGPKGSFAYISNSVFTSATATSFNYEALKRSDVIVYSDFSSSDAPDKFDNASQSTLSFDDANSEASTALLNADEYLEEMEKLDFICSCSMDAINSGGSVLIPIGRIGIILRLLERFALGLASENVKVPIFVVSSVAEELMAFTNIIPEWLCERWQDRLYSGQPLFYHEEMIKDGRLYLFPSIHSRNLLDPKSLFVMEEGVDANLALLPFRPVAMKAFQCSFLSGLKIQKSQHLLKILQPRHFPETLRQHISPVKTSSWFDYYSKSKTLHIPNTKEDSEIDIEVELARQLNYTKLKQQDMNISRLKGALVVKDGRFVANQGTGKKGVQDRSRKAGTPGIELEELGGRSYPCCFTKLESRVLAASQAASQG